MTARPALAEARLVAECAGDPPLGATQRTLAIGRAEDVLLGLGVIAAAGRGRPRAVRVRDEDAEAALRAASARLEAQVTIERVAPAWPPPRALDEEVWPAELLVALADETRGRPPVGWLTVAGAVAAPAVLETRLDATVAELVAAAGGATVPDWVAVAGGAPAGWLIERGARARDCVAVPGALLLVLPAGHEVVRRLRTSVGEWVLRARAACEGCSLCTEACPPARAGAPLQPHALVRALGAAETPDGAAALWCTGCGLCDAQCPSALSPRAVVAAVGEGLRARLPSSGLGGDGLPALRAGAAIGASPGLDVALLGLRLGLGDYAAPAGPPTSLSR